MNIMTCPVCGSPMNHHADKLRYEEGGTADRGLGGIVEEVHTCPRCGDVETRVPDGDAGPERGVLS